MRLALKSPSDEHSLKKYFIGLKAAAACCQNAEVIHSLIKYINPYYVCLGLFHCHGHQKRSSSRRILVELIAVFPKKSHLNNWLSIPGY